MLISIKRNVLFYLLVFGCLIWIVNDYQNDPQQSQLQRPRATVVQTRPNAESNQSSKPTQQPAQQQKPLSTPTTTLNPTTGNRWKTTTVNCYMVTKNPKLVQAYKMAIAAWNQTGAFHFNLTNDPNAPIKLQEQNLSSSRQDNGVSVSQELGVTNTKYYEELHQIIGADVNVDNSPQLLNADVKYISWVAEHELGHAIGLDHTSQNANSVMVPYNPTHGISPSDIATTKQLYGEK